MIHLKNTGRMKEADGCVKIGFKEELQEISETDRMTYKLTNASDELEKRIEITKQKIYDIRIRAKDALKDKNKDKATTLLREKKNLDKAETILQGQKLKIDKQIMDINMTLSTKDTLEVLKLTAGQQSIIDDDLDDARELMDAISDNNYNLQKINEMFTPSQTEDEEDDEELLKELEDPNFLEYEKNLSNPSYIDEYSPSKPLAYTEETKESKNSKNLLNHILA